MVLAGQLAGRVDQCRVKFIPHLLLFIFEYLEGAGFYFLLEIPPALYYYDGI
jgi:hypothetical protein